MEDEAEVVQCSFQIAGPEVISYISIGVICRRSQVVQNTCLKGKIKTITLFSSLYFEAFLRARQDWLAGWIRLAHQLPIKPLYWSIKLNANWETVQTHTSTHRMYHT